MPMKVAKCNKLAKEMYREVIEEEVACWHTNQKHDDMVNALVGLLLEYTLQNAI